MAELGDIFIKMDNYFKETHIRVCLALDCKNNGAGECDLKTVTIGDNGLCGGFRKINGGK